MYNNEAMSEIPSLPDLSVIVSLYIVKFDAEHRSYIRLPLPKPAFEVQAGGSLGHDYFTNYTGMGVSLEKYI